MEPNRNLTIIKTKMPFPGITLSGMYKVISSILILICFCDTVFSYSADFNVSDDRSRLASEAMKEAEEIFKGLGADFKEVNDRINQTADAYEKFSSCVKGSGDVGRECQKYVDLLYTAQGAGIEAHDMVMEGKQAMEEMLKHFEASGVFELLVSAKKIFGGAGTALSDAHNVIAFTNKFNPQGARGDPTRGLRLIGEEIGEKAKELSFPMDKIFKGYAEAVSGISDKLTKLQNTLENARQGNLGGGYAHYAEAADYFEKRFRGGVQDTDLYFDVSAQFPLLGRGVKVFQDLISLEQGYFIYEPATSDIEENGWLAPQAFATVYEYFAALPPLYRSAIPQAFRVQRLVAQARTNPGARINLAKQHYQSFSDARGHHSTERLLKEMDLLTTMIELLKQGEEAFVGLWLFIDEERNNIQLIADVLSSYVYVSGTVFREDETGSRTTAPNEPVVLDVDDGGRGQAVTDDNGNYFVYTRGEPQLTFTISAGSGDETARDNSRFLSRGFENVTLVLRSLLKTPVTLTISPAESTLDAGELIAFRAFAIYDDDSAIDITTMEAAGWSTGSNTFSAPEETEVTMHYVTVTYMNLEATATITVMGKEADKERDCGDNEEWSDEENECVCIAGFERIAELDNKCVNLDEAIDDITGEKADVMCDEASMAERFNRLRSIVSESQFKAAQFRNFLDQFMKAVNEKSGYPCNDQIIAAAYSGARHISQEFQDYEDEFNELSRDLVWEAAICQLDNPNYEWSSIVALTRQFASPRNQVIQGIANMESQLTLFGCDQQDVADLGDAVADRSADPEVISGMGTGGDGTQPPGPVTGGTTVVILVANNDYDGPLSSIRVSVNFPFRTFSFLVGKGSFDNQHFHNAQLNEGDRMQITVQGTHLNPSITLLPSDFVWIDPDTQEVTSPGNGFKYITVVISVSFDDGEDVNRYVMFVGIGTMGIGIPGFPDGYGRELRF